MLCEYTEYIYVDDSWCGYIDLSAVTKTSLEAACSGGSPGILYLLWLQQLATAAGAACALQGLTRYKHIAGSGLQTGSI